MTATYFSLFGKLTIITLIQIGGVGVVTLAVTFAVATGRKLRLSGQNTMLESVSAEENSGAWRYARFILLFSLAAEAIGALFLMPAFCSRFGARGIGYAFFHSISAYCNAGFDLMGAETGQFSSLTGFVGSPLVNFTICGLILSGGLGFSVWGDVGRNKFRLKRYSVQSKAVLVSGAILVFVPAVYFYFAEFSSAAWKAELSGEERVLASFFGGYAAHGGIQYGGLFGNERGFADDDDCADADRRRIRFDGGRYETDDACRAVLRGGSRGEETERSAVLRQKNRQQYGEGRGDDCVFIRFSVCSGEHRDSDD